MHLIISFALKAHGKGTYFHSDGAKYVGDWKDDK
jgi:hypothetical protein